MSTEGVEFPLGDPRHPWKLALLLVLSIATFPVFWFVLMILLALGSSGEVTEQDEVDMVQFAVKTAAVISAIAVVAALLDARSARRRYPPEERGTFRNLEGAICGAVVLVALAGAVAFGVWAWNTSLV